MKKLLFLVAAALFAIPFHSQGAQTAQARMWCFSLRFSGATTYDNIGFDVSLRLTTLPSGVNGELSPDFFGSGYTHSTYLEIDSDLYGSGQGAMAVDIPDFADANNNGFPDFFEVSMAVSASSSGAYQSDFGNGSVSASWQRDAGSSVGSCTLRLSSAAFGALDFYHSFELIEYTGPLTYTPGSNAVSGSVNMVQSGNPANTFQGPIQFSKVVSDPLNKLTLQSVILTNASLQTIFFYSPASILRDTIRLTNYYGSFSFIDGDLNTTDEDYYNWMLSIDDVNDSDNDGIPDFSDNPQLALPPRKPALTLARSDGNLMLTISGDINHLYNIQEIDSASSTNWQTISSVTLTADPQAVSIPLPSTTRFWRVQVN